MAFQWFGDKARAIVLARAQRATRRGVEYVAERARFHAPVDTEDLRKSIKVLPGPGPMAWRVFVGVDYADPVHSGHIAGSTWVPPNPFLWRAIADAKAAWPRLVQEGGIRSGFAREAGFDAQGKLISVSRGQGDLTATFQVQT